MHWSEKIAKLDRRWLFLVMALAVAVPIVVGMDMAPEPGPGPRAIFDAVEALPDGSVVLLSCDYDPGSEPELYPMNLAVLHHLARKKVKVIVTELWPQGPPLVERALKRSYFLPEYGKKYGVDLVNLGYKAGGQILINKMRQSIAQVYPSDVMKTKVADIPVMQGVQSLYDIDFFFIISAGTPGTKEWVQQCQAETKKPMASGVTAVSAPDFFAYTDTGQLVGLLGGLRGASDYEQLVGRSGRGVAGMASQTFGHLLIVILIILGNVGYLMARRRAGED